MLVWGAGRDGTSWASLVPVKILDSPLAFHRKQVRSRMMPRLESAGEVRGTSLDKQQGCAILPRTRQQSGGCPVGDLSCLPQSHTVPSSPCLLVAHSLPPCSPLCQFLSKELPCPALLCGLAGAQGQESPAASLLAAEQAGAGEAGRAASCPTSFWQLANRSPSLKLAE